MKTIIILVGIAAFVLFRRTPAPYYADYAAHPFIPGYLDDKMLPGFIIIVGFVLFAWWMENGKPPKK